MQRAVTVIGTVTVNIRRGSWTRTNTSGWLCTVQYSTVKKVRGRELCMLSAVQQQSGGLRAGICLCID